MTKFGSTPAAEANLPRDGRAVLLCARSALLALMLAGAGCTTVAPPAPTAPPVAAPPPTTADQRAATPAALVIERKWLQSWFEGTPVVIEQNRDGAVRIEIPREFCFDAGRTTVKPALGVVLDKVAESLHRVSRARLASIAAPADATPATTLALERGAQVQKYLQSRGVIASHLGQPTVASAAAVQLRMEAAPM